MMGTRKPSYLSLTSFFCGAGGDTQGAAAAGLLPNLAINHWARAIESHSANFRDCAHDLRDVSQTHPSRYGSTHLAWLSPECSSWSQGRGKKRNFGGQLALSEDFEPLSSDAEERSRVQMWDVCAYTEHHQYEAVIVENVVDIMAWGLLSAWYQAMDLLGYRCQTVFLNSMFVGVPQSRDRVYFVFTRKGNPAPDLEMRPASWCPMCERDTEGVQSWNRADRVHAGRYRQQYVFRCPTCGGRVLPYVNPAAAAIDWSLPTERIGDRRRPLAAATMARIRAGIDRYWARPGVFDTLYGPKLHDVLTEPFSTQTGRQSQALYIPLIAHLRGSGESHYGPSVHPVDDALGTITANGTHHGLLEPLFVKNYGSATKAGPMSHPVSQPLGSITAVDHHAMLQPPLALQAQGNTHERQPGACRIRPAAAHPPRNLAASAQPALLASYYGRSDSTRPAAEPMGTVTGEPRHALIEASEAFLSSYYGQVENRHMCEPTGTQTGHDRHALVEGPAIEPEDCGFRMLQPHEIGAGMAFAPDYVVLGSNRERVQQYGQAVTPPSAEWLWRRVLETIR